MSPFINISIKKVREILEIRVLSSEDKWDKIYEISENLQYAHYFIYLTMVKKKKRGQSVELVAVVVFLSSIQGLIRKTFAGLL